MSDQSTSIWEGIGTGLSMLPGVSTVAGIGNMAYHGGSAIYDGLHGDRDGAVAHGVQAAMSGLGAIPVVGDAMQTVDATILGAGLAGRAVAPDLLGIDPTQIPTSTADIVSQAAVMGTNAIFGADDSNWIAEGDKPTGTRAGEIQAGADVLGYAIGGPLFGDEAADFMKPLMTGAGEYFGSDLDGPTSGARKPDGSGSYAQEAGDYIHDWATKGWGSKTAEELLPREQPAPFGPPIEVPVTGPTLPVVPDDIYY